VERRASRVRRIHLGRHHLHHEGGNEPSDRSGLRPRDGMLVFRAGVQDLSNGMLGFLSGVLPLGESELGLGNGKASLSKGNVSL
jgi:hypothetical protein